MPIQLFDLAGADSELMFSPFSWRIRMALLHKGLEFEVLPWRFSDRRATAGSGYDSVPVIRDGDRWVGDSWEIARYLDREFPDRPALMQGPAGEAHARLVAATCGAYVFPAVIPVAIYQAYLALDDRCKPYFRESRERMLGVALEALHVDEKTGRATIAAALKPFEEVLGTCAFVNGETPAYTDYLLFGILKWADIVSTYRPLDGAGALGQWFQRLEAMYGGYAGRARTVRDSA